MQQLCDKLYVSPQIDLEEILEIKQKGICTILCNRPDGEEEDQVEHTYVARSCKMHGLDFIYQPVQTSAIDADGVEQFGRHLKEARPPVLAYCRTGTRCTILWALSQRGIMSDADILACATKAGYDLSRFFPPPTDA